MKKLLTGIVLLCLVFQVAEAQQKKSEMNNFNFEKAWKQVQELEGKGLPESALKEVNVIYEEAKKINDAGQLVKAVIHRLKFVDYKEEDGIIESLNALREEARMARFPAKPLLHSMLAEMYWQYYQNNRHRFADRTNTTGAAQEEIETWSLARIAAETMGEYSRSLSFADQSKATSLDVYDEVIYRGNEKGRQYRPTLYDFLAHRALNFFTQDEPNLTRPADNFTIDQETYLSDAETFSGIRITTNDTLSLQFHALTLFQELIRFHLNDADPAALVEVDLQRLTYVKSNHVLAGKDALYLKALQQLEQQAIQHPVSTRVTYQIAQLYVEWGGGYVPLRNDDHKWDRKRAFEIAEEGKQRYPDSEGAIQCGNLQQLLLAKDLNATLEKNNEPNIPFRCLVRYNNISQLYYRIIPVTRDEVRAQRKKWDTNYKVDQEQKFIEYFAMKTPVKSGSFTLPDDGDHQQHSLEVKLDALPIGEYMVLFNHKADFKTTGNGMAYAFTTISNIAYVHRTLTDGTAEVYTLHRKTGERLKGVRAEVYTYRYNSRTNTYDRQTIRSYSTDANGHVVVDYVKTENRRNFYIDFTHENDFNSTEDISHTYYYGGGNIYQYKQGESELRTQTFFFLDRAIYRPGQTVYFKGLMVETDGKSSKILTGNKTTITLYDVNYQERGSVEVTTNEYGTFHGTMTAPSTGLTGEMHLENNDGSGRVSFSVEEYKRPKFEVVFDSVQGTYRLDDSVRVTGRASAYSGAQIDGAKVHYRIIREARFPFWWWCRWGYYPTSPAVEIGHGVATTDAEGKFSVSFAAQADKTVDPSSDPIFSFTIYADVTDINGETHSSETTVSVGYKALRVNVGARDINLDGVQEISFPITTTNLAGSFEPGQGTITIHLLKSPDHAFRSRLWEQPDRHLYTREEYYALFPHDQYADELNKLKWEKDSQVVSVNFNTAEEKSLRLAGLSAWKTGEYVLEIISRDKFGEAVREVAYFSVYSPAAKKLSVPAFHHYKPIKLQAEPGGKAVFTTGTTVGKIHVLYEMEQDGKILSKNWLTLDHEQRVFEIPIKEEYRGNIAMHYTFVRHNRLYTQDVLITVPYTNKELDISFQTFRNKLQPGEKEEWKILVKGKTAEKIAAEMVATLYDASLDAFVTHSWEAALYNSVYARLHWQSQNEFVVQRLKSFTKQWNEIPNRYPDGVGFDQLNWFGYNFYYHRMMRYRVSMPAAAKLMEVADDGSFAEELEINMDAGSDSVMVVAETEQLAPPKSTNMQTDFSDVKVRSNFNETAFFYPSLKTNANGEIIISFTIPEALTRWKMLGFAHTPDLKSGLISNELVTQKDLMVVPNPPRFFREGDAITFSTKISSLVDHALNGQARLEFFDALTMKPVDLIAGKKVERAFSLEGKQSTSVSWNLQIPEGLQAVMYRVVAKAGNFSDGEEMVLPVVTNRMLVTESIPISVRGGQTKTFRFEKLLNTTSKTLRHQRYTLEFTDNPAWYAVQALPYLMEYPYDCVEQTFSRYYANSIASHIANSNPRIKQVFETWKNIQPDALLSNLDKNQELKSALLEETPWVLQAQDEGQRKRMVGLLFDLNRMSHELNSSLDKIVKAQYANGGFSWFPGLPEDRYMTQHIVSGMGHLDLMGVRSVRVDETVWNMLSRAIDYMDNQLKEDHERLKAAAKRKEINLNDDHLGYTQIHYLYTRSAFKDVEMSPSTREAFKYFLGQAKKYWLHDNIYLEGMICLALNRFDEKETAEQMMKSFRERALHSEELGMYFKYNPGYFWYQAPIETQAMMIEVFEEVAGDAKAVDEMKVWLLRQKQTSDWKTTKATTEACYALLRRGSDLLSSTQPTKIRIGNQVVDPRERADAKVEAGTGYFKTAWQGHEIKPGLGSIEVSKEDQGVAWGAVYWQYFEQLDKITPAQTPLKLKKELFLQQHTERGPVITPVNDKTSLKLGDLVKVRLEIRVDRNMEYVHIKDMRAAAFEPVAVLSTYKYQDGLHYYESPRDLATNFFIGYLPRGTYVFEYALRVSQQGDFSNGITTIQCMYAPEFSSHSAGIRVVVPDK